MSAVWLHNPKERQQRPVRLDFGKQICHLSLSCGPCGLRAPQTLGGVGARNTGMVWLQGKAAAEWSNVHPGEGKAEGADLCLPPAPTEQ